jgi:hypothetical protein
MAEEIKPDQYKSSCDRYAGVGDIDDTITALDEMKAYVLRQLGSPTICVELSDDQLRDVILDSVRYVQRYYLNVGSHRDYLIMEVKRGVSHYKLCQELESVVSFEISNGLAGGINDLFTVTHNLLYNEMHSMNGWQFSGSCWGNNSSYGDILGSWNATLVWLKELKNDFSPAYQVKFNNLTKELSLWPSPKKDSLGLIEVYKRQRAVEIFNNPQFRKLVVASAGKIWANALSKYNITIAGGGALNAGTLYSNYKEDYDKAVERIDKESPNGYFFVG